MPRTFCKITRNSLTFLKLPEMPRPRKQGKVMARSGNNRKIYLQKRDLSSQENPKSLKNHQWTPWHFERFLNKTSWDDMNRRYGVWQRDNRNAVASVFESRQDDIKNVSSWHDGAVVSENPRQLSDGSEWCFIGFQSVSKHMVPFPMINVGISNAFSHGQTG